MIEFILFLVLNVLFYIITFYIPEVKTNIIELAKSSDVFNFSSFIIGFLTLLMTSITDPLILRSYSTLDAKRLEYSIIKNKFRFPRNLFVILLCIISLISIQKFWDTYYISVEIVSLYFLALILSFRFPWILKKESFISIRKELKEAQQSKQKKNIERVKSSEKLLSSRK